ncbi:MAG: hypothetical protein NTU78_00360 [Alphaproteobacteria bacterium]|jgi:hypothetical protein|nr:hypothetical protein [Alphaproteobacteria bacterium]
MLIAQGLSGKDQAFPMFLSRFAPHPDAWLLCIDFVAGGNTFFAAQIAAEGGRHEHRDQEQQLPQ